MKIFKRKETGGNPPKARWDETPLVPIQDRSAADTFFTGGLMGLAVREHRRPERTLPATSYALPQPPPMPPSVV